MTIPSRHIPEESGRKLYGGAVLRDDELQAGEVVASGAYKIEFVLGRGGMATVYGATRCGDGLSVALKVLDPKFATRSDVEYRMANELALPAELAGHPNIAQPIDAGKLSEHGDAPYLVTEWVRGQDLTLLVVGERRLAPLRACRIALDIARGLSALHERGIVHRDIKPDNVIVVPDDRGGECAKLIDFGLVARVQNDPAAPRVTTAWERPGTKLYMAPEQALGAPASPSFDVYALGLTMHLMLTGFAPLTGVPGKELLDLKVSKAISITEARDDLPVALAEVVDGCLRIKPSERLGIAEVCERLQSLIEVLESASEPVLSVASDVTQEAAVTPVLVLAPALPLDRAEVVSAAPQRRSRWLPLAIAAVLIAALGAYATARYATDERPAPAAAVPSEAPTREPPAAVPTPIEPRPVAPPTGLPSTAPPEPVAVTETDPTPQSTEREPRPKARPRDKPQVAAAPAHESAACVAERSAAKQAETSRDWRTVLEHTRTKRCWPEPAARLKSRLRALSTLGDYEACAREGVGSQDKIAALCRAKLEAPP